MENSVGQERQLNMDLLRILACFSVVMLHSSAQFWYDLPLLSGNWLIANSYDAAFRFGVPIFVMLSGRFFLSREGEVNIKTLYRKNILRLFVLYCVWHIVYGLWSCRHWMSAGGLTLKDYVQEILFRGYHLWYLLMQIGLYMLLPVLKGWVTNCSKKDLEYFLILFLICQIGLSTIKILPLSGGVLYVMGQFNVEAACSYAGYFIFGYYLYRYPPEKKARLRLYAGGAAGLLTAIIVSALESKLKGQGTATAFDSFSVFTFLVVTALYVCFQNLKLSPKRAGGWLLKELSADTLGIYLMHVLFIELLNDFNINSMTVNIIFGIPLLALVSFVICGSAAALLRRIPVVGKYIC